MELDLTMWLNILLFVVAAILICLPVCAYACVMILARLNRIHEELRRRK